ncbi:MAG: chromosomal replication initiator protein DnaA [Candidatus Berkelbacteria bacterium]
MSDTLLSADEIWAAALPLLTERIRLTSIVTMLRNAEVISYDGTTFVLAVNGDFSRGLLVDGLHLPTITTCLEQVAKQPVQLQVEASANAVPLAAVGCAAEQVRQESLPVAQPLNTRSSHEQLETMPLNDRHTFDNFVMADCNRFAFSAAQQVCRNPGRSYNPLLIHSKSGLGKTHLMQAIGHEIRSQHSDMEVVYVSAENFVNQIISAIRDNRTAEFRRRYRYVDVWLVDDIQFIAALDGPASEEEFFHTLNTLCINDKQVVIASDVPPRQLQIVNVRLRSRLEMGILADLRAPDLETRIAILEKMAEAEKTHIPREVLEYLAKKVENNIRVLGGALLQLVAYASLHGKLTLALAGEALESYSTSKDGRQFSLAEIVTYIAERFTQKASDITGPKRSKELAWPRQVAIYLCRELTDYSLSDIGHFFNDRDHSTINYNYGVVRDRIGEDEQTLWLMNDMKAQLRGS